MPAEAAVGLATRGDWSASSACSYLVPMCGASHQLSRLHRQASHCSYEALSTGGAKCKPFFTHLWRM